MIAHLYNFEYCCVQLLRLLRVRVQAAAQSRAGTGSCGCCRCSSRSSARGGRLARSNVMPACLYYALLCCYGKQTIPCIWALQLHRSWVSVSFGTASGF